MKFHTTALLSLLLLTSGCMEVVRASSRSRMSEKQSQVVLQGAADDAARRFTELFSKRGIQLTDRKARKGGATLYVFKGQRSAVTTVSGNKYGVTSSTNTVGSIFYVLMTPEGETTRVELLGKPTLDGGEVCDDTDPAWLPPCGADVYTGAMWSGRDQMTGREEAEAIRGMLLEMELATSSGPGSRVATVEEPAATAPACVASELPEWKTASAIEKKKLLEKCRAPVDGAQAADSR